MAIDIAEDAQAPSHQAMQSINTLVARYAKGLAEIARAEQFIKEEKERCRQILEDRLPAAMDAAQSATFTTTDGFGIEIKKFASASIPSESAIEKEKDDDERTALIQRRDAAIAYLVDNKHESLLKADVALSFPKGQVAKADELVDKLKELGYDPDYKFGIHHGTLEKWVKERLEQEDANQFLEAAKDIFKIHVGRVAKITFPKQPKK